MIRKYSNPEMQAIVDDMYQNVELAQDIINKMRATLKQQGISHKSPKLKPDQQATIDKNKGAHIYGESHPLYVKK